MSGSDDTRGGGRRGADAGRGGPAGKKGSAGGGHGGPKQDRAGGRQGQNRGGNNRTGGDKFGGKPGNDDRRAQGHRQRQFGQSRGEQTWGKPDDRQKRDRGDGRGRPSGDRGGFRRDGKFDDRRGGSSDRRGGPREDRREARRDDRKGPGGPRRHDRQDDRGGRPFGRDDRRTGQGDSRDDRKGKPRFDDRRGRPEQNRSRGDQHSGRQQDDHRRSDRGAGPKRDHGGPGQNRGGPPRDGDRRGEGRRDENRRPADRPGKDDRYGKRGGDGREDRRQRSSTDRPRGKDRPDRKTGNAASAEQETKQVPDAPELPEDVDSAELHEEIRREMRSLPKGLADKVAAHLVAAGKLMDTEPERALEHARYARRRASRIGAVREANGLTAYQMGEWTEALSELRAARRMVGGVGHVAIMADCERALGRAERALELSRSPEAAELTGQEAVELRIVAAGARRDLGEIDASVVSLQIPELDPQRQEPWSARLFYAYADNLLAADRVQEAFTWFVHAAHADDETETDAPERLDELVVQLGGAEAAEELVAEAEAVGPLTVMKDVDEPEDDAERAHGATPSDRSEQSGGGEAR
ncbi:hypothetical protein INP57_26350 [Saccharopolyspora sp. HNM0986]|uniref:hypothetical protein n=2 Tax=Saccharopolyspora TaxID=1835 RepID=UPI001F17BC37|nr:hypothetical protein [Saccharopolyspora sp. HNM0986]MBK0870336.1 hypothetical protein [Saccharopolyspora sp. HNM0986]